MANVISRTITEKRYNVMTLNIKTSAVGEIKCRLDKDYPTAEKTLNAIKAKYDTADVKCVHITSVDTIDALYAMTVDAFIKAAYRFDNNEDMRKNMSVFKDAE